MSYTEEALDKLGIAQLRQVARQVGLTPSTLKKGELISGILAIGRGEAEKSKTTRKGRPAKDFGSLGEFMQSILPAAGEGEAEITQPKKSELDLIVGARVVECSKMVGVVETLKSGFGYLRADFKPSEADAIISELTILKHNILEGDIVEAEVTLFESGVKSVTKIISVNGGAMPSSRPNFSSFEPIYPSERILFSGLDFLNNYFPVGKGQRALLTGEDGYVVKNNIYQLFTSCPESKFLIALNLSPEEVKNFSNKDMQPSYLGLAGEKLEMDNIRVLVENLKRRVELGENVCLFVNDIAPIYESVKSNDEDLISYIQSNFKNTTRGSLTIICGNVNNSPIAISSAFNLVLPLNTSLDAFGVCPCIDLTKVSFSRPDGLVEKSKMANLALKVASCNNSIIEMVKLLNEKV